MPTKLIPSHSFSTETTLLVPQVVQTFKNHVEPIKWLRLFHYIPNQKTFEGSITDSGFQIRRIINYANGMRPILHGRFEVGQKGTRIIVQMRLHKYARIFMPIWFGFCIIVVLLVAPAALFSASPRYLFALMVPLLMILFGWLFVCVGFWYEVSRSRRALENLFRDFTDSPSGNRPVNTNCQ